MTITYIAKQNEAYIAIHFYQQDSQELGKQITMNILQSRSQCPHCHLEPSVSVLLKLYVWLILGIATCTGEYPNNRTGDKSEPMKKPSTEKLPFIGIYTLLLQLTTNYRLIFQVSLSANLLQNTELNKRHFLQRKPHSRNHLLQVMCTYLLILY